MAIAYTRNLPTVWQCLTSALAGHHEKASARWRRRSNRAVFDSLSGARRDFVLDLRSTSRGSLFRDAHGKAAPGTRAMVQVRVLLIQWLAAVVLASAAAVDEAVITPAASSSDPAAQGFWARLPGLVACCLLAGLVASQAVYYDDDGEPTGVRRAADNDPRPPRPPPRRHPRHPPPSASTSSRSRLSCHLCLCRRLWLCCCRQHDPMSLPTARPDSRRGAASKALRCLGWLWALRSRLRRAGLSELPALKRRGPPRCLGRVRNRASLAKDIQCSSWRCGAPHCTAGSIWCSLPRASESRFYGRSPYAMASVVGDGDEHFARTLV